MTSSSFFQSGRFSCIWPFIEIENFRDLFMMAMGFKKAVVAPESKVLITD